MDFVGAIVTAAKAAGVSPALLLSVCWVESNHRNVTNPHDGGSASVGICQVKRQTAELVIGRKSFHLERPEVNAKAAALYLAYQLRRYSGDERKAVAAFNAGRLKECSFLGRARPCNYRYVAKVFRARRDRPWEVR